MRKRTSLQFAKRGLVGRIQKKWKRLVLEMQVFINGDMTKRRSMMALEKEALINESDISSRKDKLAIIGKD